MMAQFFDLQDVSHGLNGTRVEDLGQLMTILNRLAHRRPFGFELIGENGKTLFIGISLKCGCVQFSSSDGDPPYWVAVAPGEHDLETEGMEYLIGRTLTPVLERHCVSIETLMQIIGHFLATGDRYRMVSWEEP